MGQPNDVMKIYLYRRDVDAVLATAPPKTSPLWNELNESQRNLIEAFELAVDIGEEMYE